MAEITVPVLLLIFGCGIVVGAVVGVGLARIHRPGYEGAQPPGSTANSDSKPE